MTENDAPESTRARIGFLSIITSSWLPVILAVDGGFQYTRPHLLGRSLSLVFLAPTAWRLTGSAIWRRGSVTTYWGSASRGTWRKTARRVWSAYFFFSANVVEVPSAVSRIVKDSLSLGSSALHVQDVRSGNKQVCCQPFSTHLFSWFRWEFLNRSSVFPGYSGVCWSWSSFCRFC
ncbi:hypothetical protein TNCV_4215361 [Trichonephila clavipes]|nr:hypothetical protein TNCV_4215361 [Trichonephila clavipes]